MKDPLIQLQAVCCSTETQNCFLLWLFSLLLGLTLHTPALGTLPWVPPAPALLDADPWQAMKELKWPKVIKTDPEWT